MKILQWVAILLCFGAASAWAGENATIDVGGKQRGYYLHVPADLPQDAPLVFMLHGAGGSGKLAAETYGWVAKAERAKFVLVAPDATPVFADREASFLSNPRVWNDGSGRGGANITGSDDVGLIRALIGAMAARYGIDRARIYVSGFSSGSSMAQRVGIEMSKEIAAIAPGAGQLMLKGAAPARPMPVVYLLGDKDPLAPYDGGEVRLPWGGGTEVREPAKLQPAHWARLDGCADPPSETRIGANVRLMQWAKCRGGAEVAFYTIEGLGHHWPGGGTTAAYERVAGPYVQSIAAVDTIWDFFRRFSLK